MKDVAHHMNHVLKKVVRTAKRNPDISHYLEENERKREKPQHPAIVNAKEGHKNKKVKMKNVRSYH
jgi:hypothetical protein